MYSKEGKKKASFDCNKKWRYLVVVAMNGSVVHVTNWENHTVYKYTTGGEFLGNFGSNVYEVHKRLHLHI